MSPCVGSHPYVQHVIQTPSLPPQEASMTSLLVRAELPAAAVAT